MKLETIKREQKRREKNREIIKVMKEAGHTLESIGNKIGLTRERVRQIEMEMGFPKRQGRRAPRIEKQCKNPNCDKKITLLVSAQFSKMFCSKKCKHACRLRKTIAEKRAYWNLRTKTYYHNVLKKRPDFKERVRERNMKYYNKINKNK